MTLQDDLVNAWATAQNAEADAVDAMTAYFADPSEANHLVSSQARTRADAAAMEYARMRHEARDGGKGS